MFFLYLTDPECTFFVVVFIILLYSLLLLDICCSCSFWGGGGGSITYSLGSEFIWHDATNMHMHF